MLELNDVGLFVEVVRRGSLSEAGRRLGMPSNMVHPVFTKIAHFPGNQPVAETELSASHLNHASSSRPSSLPLRTAADRD
jgi:hypothetical protein